MGELQRNIDLDHSISGAKAGVQGRRDRDSTMPWYSNIIGYAEIDGSMQKKTRKGI
jgi:hypothetical protein